MTLFEKIIAGDIPADFVYKDDHLVAFRDIKPVAPTHILIVPRKPIPSRSPNLKSMNSRSRSSLRTIFAPPNGNASPSAPQSVRQA